MLKYYRLSLAFLVKAIKLNIDLNLDLTLFPYSFSSSFELRFVVPCVINPSEIMRS